MLNIAARYSNNTLSCSELNEEPLRKMLSGLQPKWEIAGSPNFQVMGVSDPRGQKILLPVQEPPAVSRHTAPPGAVCGLFAQDLSVLRQKLPISICQSFFWPVCARFAAECSPPLEALRSPRPLRSDTVSPPGHIFLRDTPLRRGCKLTS